MKPDSWMPYYGSDFEGDTKGFSREVRWSYLAAIWHYWSVTKTSGLPNDDRQLMQICNCMPQEWGRTKPMVFSGKPYFYLIDGKWHQDRARELFTEAQSLYERRVAASRIAVEARKQNVNQTNNESSNESSNESFTKPQPQPQCITNVIHKASASPPVSRFKKPTIEELKLHAAKIGLPDFEATKFFNYYESNGWRVGRNPMKSWTSAMSNWKINWQSKGIPQKQPQQESIIEQKLRKMTEKLANGQL